MNGGAIEAARSLFTSLAWNGAKSIGNQWQVERRRCGLIIGYGIGPTKSRTRAMRLPSGAAYRVRTMFPRKHPDFEISGEPEGTAEAAGYPLEIRQICGRAPPIAFLFPTFGLRFLRPGQK